MPWDRESNEEYDDGYTRESFERADEDTGDEDEAQEAYEDAFSDGRQLGRKGLVDAKNPFNRHRERVKHQGWSDGLAAGLGGY